MPYLVCYDIEQNKLRQKIADTLIAYGLVRIQYSVFMGEVKETDMNHLTKLLQIKLNNIGSTKNNLLILSISKSQMQEIRIIGNAGDDLNNLLNEDHTLIF